MTARKVIRKALRILLSLTLVSILAFFVLGRVAPRSTPDPSGVDPKLPLFFNASPQGVRERALALMGPIARQDIASDRAASELVRLGGAALPHLLPALDGLAPTARGRVADALLPIAERMRLIHPSSPVRPDAAVSFWNRFWQERSNDFRPVVVKRWAARLAEHPRALGREDLIQLDTYALSALIDELGRSPSSDLGRLRRLTLVLSHVTGLPWRLEHGAEAKEARESVERWIAWWEEHRGEYTSLDGATRLTALVTETRYAKWLSTLARPGLGRAQNGKSNLSNLTSNLIPSLFRFTLSLAAGLGLALLWLSVEVRLKGWALRILRLLAHLGSFAPLSALALPWPAPASSPFLATLMILGLLTLSAGALTAHFLGLHEIWPADGNAGAEVTPAGRLARVLPAAATSLPFLASVLVALEYRFADTGLGKQAIDALARRDVGGWMCSVLGLSLLLLVLHQSTDALSILLRRRTLSVKAKERGAPLGAAPRLPSPARAVLALISLGALATFTFAWLPEPSPGELSRILLLAVMAQSVAFLIAVSLGSLAAAELPFTRRLADTGAQVAGAFPSLLLIGVAAGVGPRALVLGAGVLRGLELSGLFSRELRIARAPSERVSLGSAGVPKPQRRAIFCQVVAISAQTASWLVGLDACLRTCGWGLFRAGPWSLVGQVAYELPTVWLTATGTLFVLGIGISALIRTPKPQGETAAPGS